MANTLQCSARSMWKADSVAIIGASDDPHRIGGRPISYMLKRSYSGQIFPVNPGRDTVQGLPCYNRIADLPITPDLAIIAVQSVHVPVALEELGQLGVKFSVVFSSGFSESGEEGTALQKEVINIATRYGMRVLGPNTMGFYDSRLGLFPIFSSSFETSWPLPGSIALASQSGAFAGHIFSSAQRRRIGIPVCIATGNEADISIGEVISDLVRDVEIQVVGVYLEGLRDVESFLSALQLAKELRKPIILMKTGRSAVGRIAAQSHTASIAGDDAVFDAVLREFAVKRVNSPDEFLDIAYAATQKIYPVRNSLGVLTISGGAGILISDLAEDLRLPMPETPSSEQKKLKNLLPFSSVKNPVDCTAQVINQPDLIDQFSSTMMATGKYESFLGFFTQAAGTPTIEEKIRPRLKKIREQHPTKLFVLSIIASDECIRRYENDGYCVFEDPARALKAIEAMGFFGEEFARVHHPVVHQKFDVSALREDLNEAESKSILATLGLKSVPEFIATDASEVLQAFKSLGFPGVMKILSPDIKHKTEVGGVILNIDTQESALAAYESLMRRVAKKVKNARVKGVLVSKQIDGAIECIIGIKHDETFGHIAMFGLGGIFVETMKDVALKRCPFDPEDAREMVLSINGASLLLGTRGRASVDIDKLAWTLSRLSHFAAAAGDSLLSLEVNPVLVVPGQKGAYMADALIEISKGD